MISIPIEVAYILLAAVYIAGVILIVKIHWLVDQDSPIIFMAGYACIVYTAAVTVIVIGVLIITGVKWT